MKHLLYSVLVIFALLLSGCANAGKDQTVNANTLVTLNGSASTPSVKGKITAYYWRQVRGKRVRLSNKRTVSPTFTAPNVSKKTKLVFRLTTKETGGLRSPFRSRDYVAVTVMPIDDTADTTPPVITLNGGDVALTVGDTYTEQGATATDDRDGNVEVTISGNVDTTTAGVYTVTYTATDASDNNATETRTVTVTLPADTTPPVITLNGGDVALTVGDTYTEQGATATDDRDGNVEVTISGNVDTTTAGVYTVTYTATDTADNNATETRTVTVNEDTNSTANIHGTITNIAGNALKDVKVYSNTHTTYTNTDGYYVLENNGTSPVSIVAELTNYIQNSQVVDMDANGTQNFTMVYVDKIEKFDSEVGMEVKTKGAKINFPASSVAHEDGTAYTGEVTTKVAYNRVTSVTGKAAFPGDYIGETTEGNTTILRSYGFIDVTMEDNASNPLKIADGSSVTLTFPMDENIEETPATIPLWYYNTQKGIWVEDGVATYDATTNSYSGDVTHFTTWNLDSKMNPGSLEGCIEDSDGNPVTNAILNIEGAGWRSGLKQNNENTFKFLRAPTRIPVSLTAYTAQGASQTQIITLAPNENRVMADCLVIENNATSPFINVKGRLVNLDGNLLNTYSYIRIYDADTGTYLGSASTSNGIISIYILRPDSNKISVDLTINYKKISQTYTLDPNNNILDMGDIAIDLVSISGSLINQDGNPIEITNQTSISILNAVTHKVILYGTENSGNIFISSNFIRPNSNTITIKITSGSNVIERNATLTGSVSNIGNIIIPGSTISGKLLDAQGNPITHGDIYIYDPQDPSQSIGFASINADGTFTSTYFTPPSSSTVVLSIQIDGATIERTVSLNGNAIENLGDIGLSLSHISAHFTDTNNTGIYVQRVEMYNTAGSYLGSEASATDGIFTSRYIALPDDGNIILHMIKQPSKNNVYTKRTFHVDANSTDIGTIALDVVSFRGILQYLDGTPMPNMRISTHNSDSNTSSTNYYGGTNTDNEGQIDTGSFFRPNDNKVKIRVALGGEDYITTIDLNDTEISTQDITIDAVVIHGTAIYSDTGEVASYIDIADKNAASSHESYSSDSNGNFTYGPTLRPIDGNITLVALSNGIKGTDNGTTVSIVPYLHNTDLNTSFILNVAQLKGCIDATNAPNGYTSIRVNYAEPFVDYYTGINGNVNTNSFEMRLWQSDENTSLYIFTEDSNGNKTTGRLTLIPNVSLIDLTGNCQVLEAETNTTKTVTATQENYVNGDTLSIEYFLQRRRYYNKNIIASGVETVTFDTSINGIYRISQYSDSGLYGGTFNLTIDGVTHSIDIPNKSTSIYAIGLTVFEIEIYQGEVKIVEVNAIEEEPPS